MSDFNGAEAAPESAAPDVGQADTGGGDVSHETSGGSLRDSLTRAFDSVGGDESAQQQTPPADEPAATEGERLRGPDGKFMAKEAGQQPEGAIEGQQQPCFEKTSIVACLPYA